MICMDCPRECGVHRDLGEHGYCGQGAQMKISRIALHPYEEPPISGKNGSGTVFFCGCSLRCVFCQNRAISRGESRGDIYTPRQLADELLRLEEQGAANINLVTPTHFSGEVIRTLELVRRELSIPVVYNTSGYEREETVARLRGLVDIYMPDFKYMSAELASAYSHAPDYPQVVQRALVRMYEQVGEYEYAQDGTLKKGMLVRHLVLPAGRKDSLAVLERLAKILPPDKILISIMSQYTPEFALDCEYKSLHRKITRFEYETVVSRAAELGFDGFVQDLTSATSSYTPKFNK